MDNEKLILMLNAIRLELRNLNLQHITANTIAINALTPRLLEEAMTKSTALRERSDKAANTAIGHHPR